MSLKRQAEFQVYINLISKSERINIFFRSSCKNFFMTTALNAYHRSRVGVSNYAYFAVLQLRAVTNYIV